MMSVFRSVRRALPPLRSPLRCSITTTIPCGPWTVTGTPLDLGTFIPLVRRKLPNWKVCILGSNGRIGQQISFLLKLHPSISFLALYDNLYASSGELSSFLNRQLTTRTEAVPFAGEGDLGLADALDGSDLVIVTAGVPTICNRQCHERAAIIRSLCNAIVENCPQACVHMVSNPRCSMQIAKEVFQKAGTYDWTKLFGVLNDRVGAPTSQSASQTEDIGALTTGIEHSGIEMFQGTSEDATAIAFASFAFADDYLRTLNKCNSVFSFMESTYASHIKLMTSNPFLVGTECPPANTGKWNTEDLEECILQQTRERERESSQLKLQI